MVVTLFLFKVAMQVDDLEGSNQTLMEKGKLINYY